MENEWKDTLIYRFSQIARNFAEILDQLIIINDDY